MYLSPLSHYTPTPLLTISSPADRSKRVKDAKTEAQKEIEEYRKKKDDEFKEFEKQVRTNVPSPYPQQPSHINI